MPGQFHLNLAGGFVAIVLLLNAFAAVYQVRTIFAAPSEQYYSYKGKDYPHQMPFDFGDPVALTIEDTEHFQIATPEADSEWESVNPPGRGFVHLGPDQRRFGVSMFHQIHCLDMIRAAVVQGNTAGHVQHCFNYLRQTILCHADLTLEEGVPALGTDPSGEHPVNGLEMTHVCRDWTKVYNHLGDKYYEWKEWRNALNNTSS